MKNPVSHRYLKITTLYKHYETRYLVQMRKSGARAANFNDELVLRMLEEVRVACEELHRAYPSRDIRVLELSYAYQSTMEPFCQDIQLTYTLLKSKKVAFIRGG